ncbi:MAG: nucleotidyltransferase family protein [Acidobacteriota bacterium]|nr:nucleotidyltransferase family protein [Acidobacteriota bacterium]
MPQARLDELSPADWKGLTIRALRFNVGGLFYRELKSRRIPMELIPVDLGDKLRETYRLMAVKNTSLFFHAREVLKSLAGHNLPVIALKGLALAESIYGDIALRPMSDMDLLVKKEDLIRAGRILLTLGYKQDLPAWESMLDIYHHLPPFTNPRGTMIELHWNIVAPDIPIQVDLAGLWERASMIRIDRGEVLALSPEDSLLHLSLHAGYHLPTGLGLLPLCDMAGLIKASAVPIDWPTLAARAARWGGHKCVYLMLLLVRELMGAAPPDSILSGLKPDDYQPVFLAETLEQVFNGYPSGPLLRKNIGKLTKIDKAAGLKGKCSALLKAAFPPREYLATIYPVSISSPKIYLCYLDRLSRLAAHYAIVLLRLFRRDPSSLHAVHQEHRLSEVCDWMFS